MSFTVEPASSDSAESSALLAELWRELDELYGNETPTTPKLASDFQPVAFLLARVQGEAVGCVALLRLTSEIAEVKRMFVRAPARGRGIARALMERIEELAAERGFNEIWLSTGLRQPAALRLYERLGYKRIAGFGEYRDEPLNVSLAKPLRSPPSSGREKSAAD